jgi:hypothetical protein
MNHSFQTMVDGQTHESWSNVLALFSDASIYQTWAYGQVRWGKRKLSHFVLRKNGNIVAAAQLVIARLPWLPAGIAYLRSGPLCQKSGVDDGGVISEIVVRMENEYCRRRGLTLRIIPNAFSGTDRGISHEKAFEDAGFQSDLAAAQYRTIFVNLQSSPEILRKKLKQKWRNQLNRSEEKSLVLDVGKGERAYKEFTSLYEEMWNRKRFETDMNIEEFGRINGMLAGSDKLVTFLAQKEGQSIAALVCSLIGETAICLFAAANEKARELHAANFLQWQAMLWLKEHGALQYDLGGIDPESNPGGYHFKSGMGGDEASQLPPCSISRSSVSEALMRGAEWMRRKWSSVKGAGRSAQMAARLPFPEKKHDLSCNR